MMPSRVLSTRAMILISLPGISNGSSVLMVLISSPGEQAARRDGRNMTLSGIYPVGPKAVPSSTSTTPMKMARYAAILGRKSKVVAQCGERRQMSERRKPSKNHNSLPMIR